MKKILFIIISFFCVSLFGQEQELQKNTSADFYKESLILHIDFIKSTQPNTKILYVQESPYLKKMNQEIDGIQVMMISKEFIHTNTSKRKSLPITVINPLKIENDEAFIYVVNYSVTRKRKKYTMANVDRTKVKVFYDCEKNTTKYEVVN